MASKTSGLAPAWRMSASLGGKYDRSSGTTKLRLVLPAMRPDDMPVPEHDSSPSSSSPSSASPTSSLNGSVSPLASGARSAPLQNGQGTGVPRCPRCGHGQSIHRDGYWDEQAVWVWHCSYYRPSSAVPLLDGPTAKVVVALPDAQAVEAAQHKKKQKQHVKSSSKEDKEGKKKKHHSHRSLPATTSALRHDRAIFCGHKWITNRPMPVCEECLKPLLLEHHENVYYYWCSDCHDYSQ